MITEKNIAQLSTLSYTLNHCPLCDNVIVPEQRKCIYVTYPNASRVFKLTICNDCRTTICICKNCASYSNFSCWNDNNDNTTSNNSWCFVKWKQSKVFTIEELMDMIK